MTALGGGLNRSTQHQAVLGGQQPAAMQLEDLLRRFSVEWQQQRATFLG
jgi:hypothetical protein